MNQPSGGAGMSVQERSRGTVVLREENSKSLNQQPKTGTGVKGGVP